METYWTKMNLKITTKYNGVDFSSSFDDYVLNLFCDVTLTHF